MDGLRKELHVESKCSHHSRESLKQQSYKLISP